MRAVVVRRLRRSVYGKGTHPGLVEYFIGAQRGSKTMPKCLAGCVIADQARRDYQALKRSYLRREFVI